MPPDDPDDGQYPLVKPPDVPLNVTVEQLDQLREHGKRQFERLTATLTELEQLLETTVDKAVVDGDSA